jgi:parvulin-like peptidyl-prolyl isomerase
MAKGRPQATREERASRRPRTSAARVTGEPQAWSRLLLVGGVVAVLLIVGGIIGFGWYQTQIRPLGKVVLRVGETEFTLGHLERRMKLELETNPFFTQNIPLLPDSVYEQLVREAKLLEAADDELNITVTEEDVDARIRERGSLPQDVEPQVLAAEFDRQVEESGLKPSEFRQMIRAEVIEERARNFFLFVAPKQEVQARFRWIVTTDRATAEEALQRLEAGEDFAAVAQDLSIDTASADQGGEVDWRVRGQLPDQEIEDFLFDTAQPGERTEVLEIRDAFYIVELLEREERELSDTQRQVVATRELNNWLRDLDNKLEIERDFTDEDRGRALNDIL